MANLRLTDTVLNKMVGQTLQEIAMRGDKLLCPAFELIEFDAGTITFCRSEAPHVHGSKPGIAVDAKPKLAVEL